MGISGFLRRSCICSIRAFFFFFRFFFSIGAFFFGLSSEARKPIVRKPKKKKQKPKPKRVRRDSDPPTGRHGSRIHGAPRFVFASRCRPRRRPSIWPSSAFANRARLSIWKAGQTRVVRSPQGRGRFCMYPTPRHAGTCLGAGWLLLASAPFL